MNTESNSTFLSSDRVRCPHCDEDISANAKICKHCKSSLELNIAEDLILRSKSEWNPSIKINSKGKEVENTLSGCLGILLCLTGIGAIIGIPMILKSTFSSNKVKGAWQGHCPKCKAEIYWYASTKDTRQGEFQCPTCQAKIDFYEGEFLHKKP